MPEKNLKGEELKKHSASDEIKGLVKSIAGQKSEDGIRSMLLWMSKEEPQKAAIEEIWKWYYALCEVHTGPNMENYSLQRKGNQDRLKEWIIKEFGEDPTQPTMIQSNPDWWIKRANEADITLEDFVPFRFFNKIIHDDKGLTGGYWLSWFINEQNELQEVLEIYPEIISDVIMLWSHSNDDSSLLKKCNQIEEMNYKDRLKFATLPSLRRQLELWEKLQDTHPMTTVNLGLILKYPTIEILKSEIQKRLVDVAQEYSAILEYKPPTDTGEYKVVVETKNLERIVNKKRIKKKKSKREKVILAKSPEGKRDYVPNLKYQDFHHKRFQELWIEEKSQVLGYDRLVIEYPDKIKPNRIESYLVRFRKWNKNNPKKQK
jgi:hypothetical protein